jgi:hypothetical protein
MNSWYIYFRDSGDHVTSQPAAIVEGLEFFLLDGCSLEEIDQFGDLPLRHQAVLSTPESLPTSFSIDGLVGGGLLADSLAMEYEVRAVQQVAE